jgi:glycolate oxidase FAD binding subunit
VATASEQLPITETVEPGDIDQLVSVVKRAAQDETAVYPIGGGCSLDFGLPVKRPGVGLALTQFNDVVDYPARDMTVTVQAGLTIARLQHVLGTESQQLPIDVPQANRATVGGIIATNFNGPRRYGWGSIRDYVIGIRAVDGRGEAFAGGGRVVKNVAGYDFCKLLTGSLGTLGVITEVTFKLRPLAATSALLVCRPRDQDQADGLLAGLVDSQTTPTAIELLAGPEWRDQLPQWGDHGDVGWLVIGLEGSQAEVDWMVRQLGDEWRQSGVNQFDCLVGDDAVPVWRQLAEFPAHAPSPLVLKISVLPSATMRIMRTLQALDPRCSIQAHAGNGILIARLSEFPRDGLSRTLEGILQPAAARAQGNVVILSNPSGAEMTHRSAWGGTDVPFWLMTAVKREFDPRDILNPGRFVYQ